MVDHPEFVAVFRVLSASVASQPEATDSVVRRSRTLHNLIVASQSPVALQRAMIQSAVSDP